MCGALRPSCTLDCSYLVPRMWRTAWLRYVGVSAGAILAGKSCDTAYWKGWDDPTVVPEEERAESLETWR